MFASRYTKLPQNKSPRDSKKAPYPNQTLVHGGHYNSLHKLPWKKDTDKNVDFCLYPWSWPWLVRAYRQFKASFHHHTMKHIHNCSHNWIAYDWSQMSQSARGVLNAIVLQNSIRTALEGWPRPKRTLKLSFSEKSRHWQAWSCSTKNSVELYPGLPCTLPIQYQVINTGRCIYVLMTAQDSGQPVGRVMLKPLKAWHCAKWLHSDCHKSRCRIRATADWR